MPPLAVQRIYRRATPAQGIAFGVSALAAVETTLFAVTEIGTSANYNMATSPPTPPNPLPPSPLCIVYVKRTYRSCYISSLCSGGVVKRPRRQKYTPPTR